MDAVEENSIELRQDLPNEESRRIDNSKMLMGKKMNRPHSKVKLHMFKSIKESKGRFFEVFKSKKKSFSLMNLHNHLLDH